MLDEITPQDNNLNKSIKILNVEGFNNPEKPQITIVSKDRFFENPFEAVKGTQSITIDQDPFLVKVIVIPDIALLDLNILKDKKELPLVMRAPVRVLSEGIWESNDKLTVLYVHGFVEEDEHLCKPRNMKNPIKTQALASGVNIWLAGRQLPQIDLFASCDKPLKRGIITRWDQTLDDSPTGQIIGAAGDINYVGIDQDGYFFLDLTKKRYISPFNGSHFKKNIVESKFTKTLATPIITQSSR